MSAIVDVRPVVDRKALVKMRAGKVPVMDPADLPPAPYVVRDVTTDRIVVVVEQADEALASHVVQAFRRIERSTVLRAAGIRTSSNTFGYAAPSAVFQRNTPTTSAWAQADPAGHAALDDFAAWAWDRFRTVGPRDVVALMEVLLTRIHPDWRLGGTPWTSGIGNDTVPLYYHYDRNNVKGAWSAMLAARAGTRGGHLHIADYDLAVPIRNGDVLFFPGVDLMHGVTPIEKRLDHGFRYTFVWYPVRAFDGLPGAEDARAASQRRRTALEADQIARQRDQGLIR